MSVSALTLIVQALAANDIKATSNPTRKPIDWRRPYNNLPFENASTQAVEIDAGGTVTLFDSARTLTIDGTTVLSLATSPLDPTRYRLSWTGGTNPGFRTDRALALDGIQLTLTLGQNLALTVQAPSGTPFSAIQVGDIVFVPGVSTGDPASPFNPLNEGFWTVIATNGTTNMVLARAEGTVFSGTGEVVTPSDNTSMIAFSAIGAKVGDTLDIAAGGSPAFAVNVQHSFEIVTVTSGFIEFLSTAPLGPQVAQPGTYLAIYASAKRFLLVETDQEVAMAMNGGSEQTNRVSPIIPGDCGIPGLFVKLGPVWTLVITNRSTLCANLVVATAE